MPLDHRTHGSDLAGVGLSRIMSICHRSWRLELQVGSEEECDHLQGRDLCWVRPEENKVGKKDCVLGLGVMVDMEDKVRRGWPWAIWTLADVT